MLLSIKLFKDIFLDKLQATDETVPSTRDKAMSWRKMGPIMCRSHVIHALLGGPLRRLHTFKLRVVSLLHIGVKILWAA